MPSQAAHLGPLARSLQKRCLTCAAKADRLCAGCHGYYCSRKCQKEDWRTHKPSCNHDRADRVRQDVADAQMEKMGWDGILPSECTEMLHKWCKVYEPFIEMAVIDIFRAQGPPDLHLESMIVIDLKPATSLRLTRAEALSVPISRCFLVEDARVITIEEFRSGDIYKVFGTSFDHKIECSKAIRAKEGVGAGICYAAVSVEINGIGFTQMNTFQFKFPSTQEDWTNIRNGFPAGATWLDVLTRAVAQETCL